MGDVSGCQPTLNNLAFYLQGVSVQPSSSITSEYFVTASLPSSAISKRVWQFTTQGTMTGTSTLTLDYTQAAQKCPLYNITFEGALNGLLTIHNQTFSANKYMSYTLLSQYVLQLTVKIPKKILECYGAGTTQDYYFDVYVNDAATSSCRTPICTKTVALNYQEISGTTWDNLDFSEDSSGNYNQYYDTQSSCNQVQAIFYTCFSSSFPPTQTYDIKTLFLLFVSMSGTPTYTFTITKLGSLTKYYIVNYTNTCSSSVNVIINYPTGTTGTLTVSSNGTPVCGTFDTSGHVV